MCTQTRELLAETMRKVVQKVMGGSAADAEKMLNERMELTQHQCYKMAVTHYKSHCFNWHSGPQVHTHFYLFIYLFIVIPTKPKLIDLCKLTISNIV